MGQQLEDFFEQARAAGGMPAVMRLALRTGIPTTKAGAAPDSPEMVKKFKDALAKIRGNAPSA